MGLRGVAERIHPEDGKRLTEELRDLTKDWDEGQRSAISVYRWKRKDGEYRWFSDNSVFIRYSNEQPAALIGAVRDITAQKQAEEALRESEKRLASIYDTVGDVIFVLDVEKDGGYRFTSVNSAFLAATGLPAEAVVGKRVNDVIPEPSLTLALGKYGQAVREKGLVRWEETTDYPVGRVTGEVSVAPAFDEGGHCSHLVGAVL